jgi:hypothetical protein
VLTLGRAAFTALLGSLSDLRNVWRFEALRRVPLFDRLTDEQRSALAAAMTQVVCRKGDTVVKQVGGTSWPPAQRLLFRAVDEGAQLLHSAEQTSAQILAIF